MNLSQFLGMIQAGKVEHDGHDPGNKSHLFPPALEEEFSENRLSVQMCQIAYDGSRKLLRKSREMACLDFSHEFWGSCFRLTHWPNPPTPRKKLGLKARGEPKVRSARKWLRKSGMVGNSPGSTWMPQVLVTLSRLKLLCVFQNLPGF